MSPKSRAGEIIDDSHVVNLSKTLPNELLRRAHVKPVSNIWLSWGMVGLARTKKDDWNDMKTDRID